MKIFLFLFQKFLPILIYLLVFPVKAEIVENTSGAAPKKEMSASEMDEIFRNLQFNGKDASQFEHIERKAKTHYIPIEIILWLKKASLLNPEALSLKKIMQEEGYEMKNPNIRLHVVNAFMNTVSLHPLTPELIRKLALWMKELREQNLKIKTLHQKYLQLQKEEMAVGTSFKEFAKEHDLPPSYLENQSEIETIYKFLYQTAQTQSLPLEIVNELVSALESEEIPLFTLMDPLLDALMAVARNQGFQQTVIYRLQEIKSDKRYISYEGQINNILKSDKSNQCQKGFRTVVNRV